MNSLSDQQLLREYAENRSESAFAELVRRHVDLVYSAALRLVRDGHMAEDVTQGVFIALARHAHQLTQRAVLSGWLHRTAENLGANAVRSDVRRRAREQESAAMNPSIPFDSDASWELVAPQIDTALGELNDTDRDALLLRYFERKSAQQMAEVLGVSDEAAQRRVSRAVERLREVLAKRGVGVGSGGLMVLMTAHAVQAAPAGLALTISTAAMAGTVVAAATSTILMGTFQKTAAISALAVVFAVPLYLQHRSIRNLQAENVAARERAELAHEAARTPAATPSAAADLERLQREHAELLRLRNEVSRLRQQVAEDVASKRPAPVTPSEPPVPTVSDPTDPIQIFVATADATVPRGQTLAIGGWETAEGKRVLVLLQPKIEAASSEGRLGSIFLQGQFIEAPEAVLDKLASDLNLPGLSRLKVNANVTAVHSVFTQTEAALLFEALKESEGADVLSSPRIQTPDGTQAVLSVTENKIIAGHEHALGPSLDIEPRIAADGTSVKLTVVARLKKANAAASIP